MATSHISTLTDDELGAVIFLDDNFPEHPKVVKAGPRAAWLFVAGLGWLKRHGSTDGRIPKEQVPLLAAVPRSCVAKLLAVTLWVDDGDCYVVPKYATKNAKAIETSEKRRKAARARWNPVENHGGDVQDGCKPDANASASASSLHMPHRTSEPVNQVVDSPVTGSSSVAGVVGEEELAPQLATEAAALHARRRLAERQGPPIKARTKWLEATASDWLTGHRAAWVVLEPECSTPEELLRRVEAGDKPRPAIRAYVAPVLHVPDDGERERARAIAAATRAKLRGSA